MCVCVLVWTEVPDDLQIAFSPCIHSETPQANLPISIHNICRIKAQGNIMVSVSCSETWPIRLKLGLSITLSTGSQLEYVWKYAFFCCCSNSWRKQHKTGVELQRQPVLNQQILYIFTVSFAGLTASLYFNLIHTAERFRLCSFGWLKVRWRLSRDMAVYKTLEPTATHYVHICQLYDFLDCPV